MTNDFVVSASWNPRSGKIEIIGRNDTYEDDAPDVFYLSAADAENLPQRWAQNAQREGDFVRVRWPERAMSGLAGRLDFFSDDFKKWGIKPLEADVDPVRRYILDHPAMAMPEPDQWHVFQYDIETEKIVDWKKPWRQRVLSFSWKSKHLGKSGHVRLAAKTDAAERELFRTFHELLLQHDVAIAWSHWDCDTFDHKVMWSRGELLGVPLPGDIHLLDHLTIYKRHMTRVEDGGQRQSFKLDAIAQLVIGTERKVPLEERARELGWNKTDFPDVFSWTWEHAPELHREYNDQDVHLMDRIEEKTGFVALHLMICKLCRILPTKWSQKPLAMIDGRLLTRGAEVGFRFPTKPYDVPENPEKARGAYVPEAQLGLFEEVAVLDYSKMYPSIIMGWNMSLETISPDGEAIVPLTTETGAVVDGKFIARFKLAPEGVIPSALRIIIAERKKWSKIVESSPSGSPEQKYAKRLSNALKVLANTFYGALLSPYARFYRADIGSSVTSIGRLLLSRTVREVEALRTPPIPKKLAWSTTPVGRLIFGDTDSVSFQATVEDASKLHEHINANIIPSIVDTYGARKGEVSLGYDKHLSLIVVTASKKYAGKLHISGGQLADHHLPPDIRGLEIVRSDGTTAARNLQRAVVVSILSGTPPSQVRDDIIKVREAFLRGETPNADLVLRKSLTKEIKEYENAGPHVQVARRMVERGEEVEVGQKIPYLWDRAGGPVAPYEVEEEDGSKLDLGLYWNKYVWPPTYRVVTAAFPRDHWEFDVSRGTDPNQLDIFSPTPAHKEAPETPRPDAEPSGTKRFVPPPERRVRKLKPLAPAPVPEAPPAPPVSTPRVRKLKPLVVPAPAPAQPARPVRRLKPPTLTIAIPENATIDEGSKALFADFPGGHPVELTVRVTAQKATVTLRLPVRCASPAEVPVFAQILGRLGWRWNIAGHGTSPTP